MTQYVYGKNVVKALLADKKKVYEIILSDGFHDKELEQEIRKRKIPCKVNSRKKMDTMFSGSNHQGIAAKIDDYKTYTIEELVAGVPKGKTPLFVMLDELEDPHNLLFFVPAIVWELMESSSASIVV